jgi:nucleoid-associated protein YgaU
MTRETKIGLLVGLAFIIVIGILLSDHLTSSTEPPPATLANAGSNVMQTLSTPGGAQVPAVTAPPPQQQVTPNQTVPTSADLTPQPAPVQIVQIGPGSSPQQAAPISVQAQHQPDAQPQMQVQAQPTPPVVTMSQEQPTAAPNQVAQRDSRDDESPVITQVPNGSVDRSLAHAAQRNGESLVALDGSGRPTSDAAAISWTQALTGMREHKAEPGDSVSKMAARFLGGNTKANRELIVRANPSLQKDPNKVIVGQTYLIPAPAGAPANAQVTPQAPPPQMETAAGPTVASASEYVYTVKEGDTLWKIAEAQLGDPNARTAIKELNRLPDENRIHVGMKLKLPGKPIAQAGN